MNSDRYSEERERAIQNADPTIDLSKTHIVEHAKQGRKLGVLPVAQGASTVCGSDILVKWDATVHDSDEKYEVSGVFTCELNVGHDGYHGTMLRWPQGVAEFKLRNER